MSKTDDKQLSTQEVLVLEEKKYWKDPRAASIFNLFVTGKDINFIAETLSMKPVTVEALITNKFFITKLETHIRGVLFTNQVAKVIASVDIFSKLWDRVSDNIEDIPPEICLKELTKLFPRKKEGMIINPKNMNVFMSVLKGQTSDPQDLGDRLSEMDDDMGFEGLEEDDDAIYPELGEGQEQDAETGIEQGDPKVDPTEPSTNQ